MSAGRSESRPMPASATSCFRAANGLLRQEADVQAARLGRPGGGLLRRGEAAATVVRLFEAAHQIAPHPLDQRRLLIEKTTDRCSNGSSRTPCRNSSRSAKLICRAAGRATAQLREPPAAGQFRCPSSSGWHWQAVQCGANHLSNERHRASTWQVKHVVEKPWKCPFHRTILPFATETS